MRLACARSPVRFRCRPLFLSLFFVLTKFGRVGFGSLKFVERRANGEARWEIDNHVITFCGMYGKLFDYCSARRMIRHSE
ncbi:hypothetical protein B0I72DRAFT_138964 [Yarrowia lipolytica]|nr:hypothetical protein B0I72DRAFT_138964 [Yarrowia lipolytica]